MQARHDEAGEGEERRVYEVIELLTARELFEETGVRATKLVQLHTFGDPKRDPRGRNISVAYLAVVDADKLPSEVLVENVSVALNCPKARGWQVTE